MKLIRLTERDLHRIIENTVSRVLNEVKLPGGDSVHGNNEEDWYVVSKLRAKKSDRANNDTDREFHTKRSVDDNLTGHHLPNSKFSKAARAYHDPKRESNDASERYHAERRLNKADNEFKNIKKSAQERADNVERSLNKKK